MTPTRNSEQQDHSWEEIPSFRKHLYFYLFLVVGTILADTLVGTVQSNGCLPLAPAPPRMTSQDVYPAPVPALSPKPSDEQ